MAKLMNPLMASEARGRVGGTVYNTWRGTRYAKQQTAPAQPRSSRQLQIRAWCTYLVRLWQTIGAANIVLWNNYAVAHPEIDWTNSPKRITGLNWFVRCNLRLLDLTKTVITAPPTSPAPGALTTFNAADGADDIVLTWDATADWGDYVDIFIHGPHSAGVQAKIQSAKHNSYAQGPSGTATIAGVPAGSYTIWARITYQDTGLSSPWVSHTCVIT